MSKIKKKICVITGSRAEFGLLYWLMKEIEADKKLELQLIVTGMHLSQKFGLTYKEIEKNFKINQKIDMRLSSDDSIGISNSMGLVQPLFAKAYQKLKPDMVLVLGDRYEIFIAASTAMIAKIPIAHIHGGERTEGSYDEAIRHCITKMSHLHFTATKTYKNRVIQLGESPRRVFNVGGMGVEGIKRLKLLSKKDFEKSINHKLNSKSILVVFHPTTLENNTSKKDFTEILKAVNELEHTTIIFTKTNSDSDGEIINKMIDDYANKNSEKSVAINSMGQLKYLSALKYVDAILGNSSSGLLEAPSFKIATINVGHRQRGRIQAKSVINCFANKKELKECLKKIYSKNYQKLLRNLKNPYDNGYPSKKITKVLKSITLKNILKKTFYDINY